jgi:hypothetical protein
MNALTFAIIFLGTLVVELADRNGLVLGWREFLTAWLVAAFLSSLQWLFP